MKKINNKSRGLNQTAFEYALNSIMLPAEEIGNGVYKQLFAEKVREYETTMR